MYRSGHCAGMSPSGMNHFHQMPANNKSNQQMSSWSWVSAVGGGRMNSQQKATTGMTMLALCSFMFIWTSNSPLSHHVKISDNEGLAPAMLAPTSRMLQSFPETVDYDGLEAPSLLHSIIPASRHSDTKALEAPPPASVHVPADSVEKSSTSALDSLWDVIRLPQNDSWEDALTVHESEKWQDPLNKQIVPALESSGLTPEIFSRIPLRPNIFCPQSYNLNPIDLALVKNGGKPIISLLLPSTALNVKQGEETTQRELAAVTCQVLNVTRLVFPEKDLSQSM